MARPNGTDGGKNRRHDDEKPDPDRTQRTRPVQKAVDDWFSDDPDDDPEGGRR